MEIESWQMFVGGFCLALKASVKRRGPVKEAFGLDRPQRLRV